MTKLPRASCSSVVVHPRTSNWKAILVRFLFGEFGFFSEHTCVTDSYVQDRIQLSMIFTTFLSATKFTRFAIFYNSRNFAIFVTFAVPFEPFSKKFDRYSLSYKSYENCDFSQFS